jgi:hypothetical protein
VAFARKVDEAFCPVEVYLSGAQAEMPAPDRIPDLIEQPMRFSCWSRERLLRVLGVTHFAIRKTGPGNPFGIATL